MLTNLYLKRMVVILGLNLQPSRLSPDWTYENNPCCYYMPTIAVYSAVIDSLFIVELGTCITDSSTVIMFSTFHKF